MTRSTAREIAMHLIYAMDCTGQEPEELLNIRMAQEYYAGLAEENDVYTDRPNQKQYLYIQSVLGGVKERRQELDERISQYAIGWNLGRISRLTKAILELAIYESLYVEDVPASVAINEAVELSKKYDSDETPAFVNGILGSFARAQDSSGSSASED